MTERKPLEWFDSPFGSIGVEGQIPGCVECCDLLFTPLFREAVYTVAIDRPGSPADMARRAIDHYHARRHPADELSPSDGKPTTTGETQVASTDPQPPRPGDTPPDAIRVIRWEKPPPERRGGAHNVDSDDRWIALAEELRTKPGQSALIWVGDSPNAHLVAIIREGRRAPFRPMGTYTACNRTVGRERRVYASYVGEVPQAPAGAEENGAHW